MPEDAAARRARAAAPPVTPPRQRRIADDAMDNLVNSLLSSVGQPAPDGGRPSEQHSTEGQPAFCLLSDLANGKSDHRSRRAGHAHSENNTTDI